MARCRDPDSNATPQTASMRPSNASKKPAISVKVTTVKQTPTMRAPQQVAAVSPGPALGMEAGAEGSEEISDASQRRKEENIKAMLGQK